MLATALPAVWAEDDMRIRNRQMRAQNGRCYYCQQPMWLQDINGFCAQYGLSKAQSLQLKCTAEHLVARSEGGPDSDENIVAACQYCNQARHEGEVALSAEAFRQFVRAEMKAGAWHKLVL